MTVSHTNELGPIAIDGPAAAGKTTVGRALAARLGYGFLDTGLMYRAFTLAALRESVDPADVDACTALVERLDMRIELEGVDARILLGGEDVTSRLRDDAVEGAVSAYSTIPAVRQAMVTRQRALASDGRMVLAGRDVGTVVLPGAPLKIFLTADDDERNRRRAIQAAEFGPGSSEERSRAGVQERDSLDRSRAASPLAAAEDAIVIDTTTMSLDAVVAEALRLATGSRPAAASAELAATDAGAAEPADAGKGRREKVHRPRSDDVPDRPWVKRYSTAFYWFSYYLMHLLLRLVAWWKCTGREHVPASGPVILVSNHLNNTDPLILSAALGRKRRVRFMAKVELFRGRWGWIAPLWGAFPLRRFEADIGAVLVAERLLRGGGVLGMFPEGTRSRTATLQDFHPGTATLALRTGASILPCSITGTDRLKNLRAFFTRPHVTVRFGPPLAVERVKRPTPEQVSELTAHINIAIRSVLPVEYGGTYTG